VTAPLSGSADPAFETRWRSPIIAHRFDTTVEVRSEEVRAIQELGVRNLRRFQYHDPSAPGWHVIRRLLRPLEAVNAGLDSPPTPHRRRAMLDVVAVLLVRCAEVGRTFWGWTGQEWIHLLGRDQAEFRRNAPAWAGDEVRPYLAGHAHLLGSFTEFHRLGSFQRLTLSWRIFGRERVSGEIARVRAVLAEWGYRLGRDDDPLLPMVLCQLFLLRPQPAPCRPVHRTVRSRPPRPAAGGFAAEHPACPAAGGIALGFCDLPRESTGRHSARATGDNSEGPHQRKITGGERPLPSRKTTRSAFADCHRASLRK
jgi:hypothetical protein